MGAVVLALTWACAIGITTTASRMTWSFARDRGTPFSGALSRVAKHNKVPIIAICVVSGLASLLHLIYIGSAVAFNDVVSLTITGFYSSYLLPASLLLYRRVKGQIGSHASRRVQGVPAAGAMEADVEGAVVGAEIAKDSDAPPSPPSGPTAATPHPPMYEGTASVSALQAAPLTWGPFHIPGMLGIVNNAYACCYMVFVIFWSVWPPATPVTAETMNYSVVVTGGVVIFSVVWYFFKGRKEYSGPVVDEEVREIVVRRASLTAM
jgi:choline transport protein